MTHWMKWAKTGINLFFVVLLMAAIPAQVAFARAPLAPNLVAPAAFSKISPSDGLSNVPATLTLSWNASAGAASYKYCVDATNDGQCDGNNWLTTTSTTATVSLGAYNTQFWWLVCAVNVDGETCADGNTWWSFLTGPQPGAFSKSSPSNGVVNQNNSITLSWQTSLNATAYDFCYQTVNTGSCSSWINNYTSTTATLTGLSWDTTYYWQVRARGAGGDILANSGSWWSFKTAAVPAAFTKSAPISGTSNLGSTATLSWNTSAGAASYSYCYDTTNDNQCDTSWVNMGSATSVNLSGLATGTSYYWQVRAQSFADTVEADGGTWWVFSTLPAAPASFVKLSPSSGSANLSTSVTIKWQASTGAASYEYCYSTVSSCTTWTDAGTALQANLTGLSAGTTYYWHVRANNLGGTTYSDSNTYWSFTTGQYPAQFNKSTPANNAVNLGITSVTLTWQSSANAVSYDYCYDTTVDGICDGNQWVSAGSNTSVTITNLNKNTKYSWQVRAKNGTFITYANSGQFWAFTTAGDLGTFGKSSPADGATGLTTSVTLTWGAATNAARYDYCYDTTNDNLCSSWISAGTSTTANITVATNVVYYWHVRAVNALGESYSDANTWWSFSTYPAKPAAFTKTSPANAAIGQTIPVTLQWGASAGATSYEYCYSTTTTCSVWSSVATNQVSLSGLTDGVTYYWQVRAVNAGGTTYADGSATALWSFTTYIAIPFNKSSPSNGLAGQPTSLILTWGSRSGATSYDYCIDTTNDSTCTSPAVWTNTGTTTSASVSLSPATTYYWQVRANTSGGSIYADGNVWWSFTTTSVGATFNKVSPANAAANLPVTLTLSWSPRAGDGNTYAICVDTISNTKCDTTWQGVGSATSAKLTLAQNTTFYWQVRAVASGKTYYADGQNVWWSFQTGILPGAFLKTSPKNNALGVAPASQILEWAPASGALSYSWCIDQVKNYACDTKWNDVSNTTTQVTVTDLQPGKTYYWQVRANNDIGSTMANNKVWWNFKVYMDVDEAGPVRWDAWQIATPLAGATGHVYHYTNVANSTAAFTTLAATSIFIDTYHGPNQGIAEVCIDGSCQNLDLYSATSGYTSIEFPGLSNAAHNVTFRVTGLKNPASAGKQIRFDGYRVNGIVYSDMYDLVDYNSWKALASGSAFNGYYRMSGTAGATAKFTFTGTQIGIISAKGPNMGIADIYVDGVLVTSVDLYDPAASWQYIIQVTGLANATHTVQIRVSGLKNASSSGTGIVVDGIRYYQ